MRLVDEEPVHAEVLEAQTLQGLGGAEVVNAAADEAPGLLEGLDRPVALAGRRTSLLDRPRELVDATLEVVRTPLGCHLQLREARLADDDGVPVARGDARPEAPRRVRRRRVGGGHEEHLGRWVEAQEVRRPLLGDVVGDGEEGLPAAPKALRLHRGRYALEGLASADRVGDERALGGLERPLHGIELVRPERDLGVVAGERKVRAVIGPRGDPVHAVVVYVLELPCALGVLPHPFRPRLAELVAGMSRGGGGHRVGHPALWVVG